MQTEQIAVRMPLDLLAELDGLVASGRYDGRARQFEPGLRRWSQLNADG